MTIYEYEEQYVHRQNSKFAKGAIGLVASLVGVIMFYCLFTITMQLWNIHMYAGIAGAVVSVVMYILFFIVPLVKIMKAEAFVTNTNHKHAKEAQLHNRNLRKDIAGKIVDFANSVDGVGWYNDEIIGKLEVAVQASNHEEIKNNLTDLYTNSVKKTAKEIILKSSIKSGLYAAVSQNNAADTALVVVVNLQMIRDILFLYGFRPSDARLLKIMGSVLTNALISYGVGGAQIGNGVMKSFGDMVKGIPLLGPAVATAIDMTVQGATNGILTTVIGYQTMRYLNQEYHLQDVLDTVELNVTEEEVNSACKQVQESLKKK